MRSFELDLAARELRDHARRVAERATLTVVATVGAGFALFLSLRVALAFVVGAVVEAFLLVDAEYARRDLISRLALYRPAYALPEVARYGARSTQDPQLHRLAAWLSELPAEAELPGNIYVKERVTLFAPELEAIACELRSQDVVVDPPSAVACRRLLTQAVESPLYNARVPADELRAELERIRSGIRT